MPLIACGVLAIIDRVLLLHTYIRKMLYADVFLFISHDFFVY